MGWNQSGQLTSGYGVFITYVNHGATNNVARPSGAAQVFWDGSVAPLNASTGDRWFDTTTNSLRRYNGTLWTILSSQPVIIGVANASTITPNVDISTGGSVSAMAQNFTIANPTGTPVDMQEYKLRIKSTGIRTITWGTIYRAGVDILALPTATSGNGITDYFGFLYNAIDTKWDLVSVARGY